MLTIEPQISPEDLGVVNVPQPQPPLEHHRPAKQPGRADGYAQMMVLSLLLVAPALICLHSACANDPDIWWHLRTGQWIFQHHSIPRIDPFSGPDAGKPWPAYSWLFEVLTFGLLQKFGLTAIVGYSTVMMLAITTALYHLVRRMQADFSAVALIVFSACFSLGHLLTPRPWLFTILLFIFEVDILMHVRRTGRVRELLWLPLIFALWVNIHIQFIDGLVVLGIALVESVATSRGVGEKTRLGMLPAAAVLVASLLATLANPFGWHIYQVAYDLASQPGVLNKINELKAIPFRSLTDWSVLALTLGATIAIAREGRGRIFEWMLLAFGIYVSFRSQRDVWVVAVAAATVLAVTIAPRPNLKIVPMPRFSTMMAAVAATVLLFAGFRVMHINEPALAKQVGETYPVKAVEAIQANHYPGPLYNDFNWGGYLIWSQRMPVSIDGRAAFYGDKAIDRSVATWNGEPDWNTDSLLKQAGIVIGPPKAALTQLLRLDPKYKLVYEDKVATVFIARR
ncbi:MAG TPA: hypothetical protein VG714_04435 [Acidobacteriaceae bacterium]|nr:hypothetical protein [Acidobacteriaceae bacterium]